MNEHEIQEFWLKCPCGASQGFLDLLNVQAVEVWSERGVMALGSLGSAMGDENAEESKKAPRRLEWGLH